MTDKKHDLDENWRDRIAQVTGAAASAIPFVGGALGEIITQVIPGQRIDRIAEYLRKLETRIASLEGVDMASIAKDVDAVDLLERGGYAAVRATSSQRIDHIVELVARGLSYSESDLIRRKRLLSLLSDIDEDQVLLLKAYAGSYDRSPSDDPWTAVNRPTPAHLQSSQDEIDSENLFKLGSQRLLTLGLLREVYPSVKRGELPPFDHMKKDFKKRIEISQLGRLLLRELGYDVI